MPKASFDRTKIITPEKMAQLDIPQLESRIRWADMDIEFAGMDRGMNAWASGFAATGFAGVIYLGKQVYDTSVSAKAAAIQALQDWQTAQIVAPNVAKVTFAQQPTLKLVVNDCIDYLEAAQPVQPYTLQPDGTLGIRVDAIPAAKVNKDFVACVQQTLQPVAQWEPDIAGYGLTAAVAAGLAFAAVNTARKTYLTHRMIGALGQEKRVLQAELAQRPPEPEPTQN